MARFGIVKGANKWRVVEFVGHVNGIDEYRYATDPLSTKGEAVAVLKRLQKAATTKIEDAFHEHVPVKGFLGV